MYMGIFKRLLGKEIRLENKFSGELVYPVLHRKKLKVDSTAIVPEGYAFVLGYNGRVLDVYSAGKNQLNFVNMPETVKKLKLAKPDETGKFVKKIKVNGYYVNLQEFVLPWKTYRRMTLIDSHIGYYKAKTSGELIFKVNDAKNFIKAMLTQYSYLKKGEAIKIFTNFISEYLTTKLEKNNYCLKDALSNTKNISDDIITDMRKKFAKYGVDIENLYIREYTVNKKLTKYGLKSYTLEELEKFSETDQSENKENFENEKTNSNKEIIESQNNVSAFTDYGITVDTQSQAEEVEENNVLIKDFYNYKDEDFYRDYSDNNFETTPYEITNPFASEEIINSENQEKQKECESTNSTKDTNNKSVWGNYENWDNTQKTTKQVPKFVDLDLENLYDKEKEK